MENLPQNPNQPEQYPVPPLEPTPTGLNQPPHSPKKLTISIIILVVLIGGYFALAKYQSWWPFGSIASTNSLEINEFFSQKCNFFNEADRILFVRKQTVYTLQGSKTYDVNFKYPSCFKTENDPYKLNQQDWVFVRNDSINLNEGKTKYPNMMFRSFGYIYPGFGTIKSQELTIGKFKAVRRTQGIDTQKCEKSTKERYPDLSKNIKDFVEKICQDKYRSVIMDVFPNNPKFENELGVDTIFGLTITFDRNDPLDYELLMDKIISTLIVR